MQPHTVLEVAECLVSLVGSPTVFGNRHFLDIGFRLPIVSIGLREQVVSALRGSAPQDCGRCQAGDHEISAIHRCLLIDTSPTRVTRRVVMTARLSAR